MDLTPKLYKIINILKVKSYLIHVTVI